MTMPRRQPSGELKAKVVLEALRGGRTINELAAEYGVPPIQMTQWKKGVVAGLPQLWSRRRGTKSKEEAARKAT